MNILLLMISFFQGFNPSSSFMLTNISFHRNLKVSAKIKEDIVGTAINLSKNSSLDPDICSAFTLRVCSAKARRKFQLDEYYTLGTLDTLATNAGAQFMNVEESTCLGHCKQAPCVAVEHEDYYGHIALEGMTEMEFAKQAFLNVAFDEDVKRVWECVEGGVRTMMEMEDEDGQV
eukprot:CAMPEP_0113327772 /NCGR_PEP_ID=MMETSP0010_2-20120614/19537_1 /TAXON_ID=216773 ORGANISM="Corethron hystrix, Strain 308" /NCGR_SAMPLE_ID=MMETSP0010_2 /ASSEMBLY_ACC=CAM_ASM_000155 /LENGTH=174 /DNA_ID=CAMNT_0000188801 /DNA_START=6 /DNA_END=530 /DNA_ORIENTATION=- /assembly_acc=CAM_ASM_000155